MSPSQKNSRLNAFANRLFLKEARISEVKDLNASFRLITIQSDQLRDVIWDPGCKLQVSMGSVLTMRTYTPFKGDPLQGQLDCLVFSGAGGPGSLWASEAKPGDACHVFGPRESVQLPSAAASILLIGDETSMGLSLAAQSTKDAAGKCRHLFEVRDPVTAAEVLDELGLKNHSTCEILQDGSHLDIIRDEMTAAVAEGAFIVLTGNAATIQKLRQVLRELDFPRDRLSTKAYWAAGKVGLD